MPVSIPQPDDLVAFILYYIYNYIICGCEHVKSHWKCLNYMGNIVHPFCLNLFNLFMCINFFRLAILWKQTAPLGKSSCADKIKRLSVWKVRTDRKLNKLEGTTKQTAITVFPFHRRNSVLCTWFEAHTHISNDTSSINILDYYQCLGEILLAAAVHWELIDMTHLLYMNLKKKSIQWSDLIHFMLIINYAWKQLLRADLFPALGLHIWAVCTSDILDTLTLAGWLTP